MLLCSGCLMGGAPAVSMAAAGSEEDVLRQLTMLNQIPEADLHEKSDPAYSVLKKIYDLDAPDFLTLRTLVGRAGVRKTLNPSARVVCANIISQRWDSFVLSGNLYLAGLNSRNLELREKAQGRLAQFIQPAHLPVLIDTLKTPGPNVAALDVLREVTQRDFGTSAKAWQAWWDKSKGQVDLVGTLLNTTRSRLSRIAIEPIDTERFWYAPESITHVLTPYDQRSVKDQNEVDAWNRWAMLHVKPYVDTWGVAKPVIDRIKHQPDPRVNAYFEELAAHPGWGDYASVVLAWRSSRPSLPAIQGAGKSHPTVGRALARGSLGDLTALDDLLDTLEKHQKRPMAYAIMDDINRQSVTLLRQLGMVPAELAFELLAHKRFDFDNAATAKEKRKAFKAAKKWLAENREALKLDKRRGFYTAP